MEGMGAALQVETTIPQQVVDQGEDPMEIRWGINCAKRDNYVDHERAGFTFVPFGQWYPVTRFSMPEAIHTVDEKMPREVRVTKTARSAQLYLGEMLSGNNVVGNRDPQKPDWGGRFGFNGETDAGKMAVISASILPNLSEIRELARTYGVASPIEARCPSQTATDDDRETCAMCWMQWIDSDACDIHMEQVARTGRLVDVTDIKSGLTERKTVLPTITELTEARRITMESLQRGIIESQNLWRTIATELDKGERRDTDHYQDNVRRDIHADKPADANLRQVREYAKAVQGVSAAANGGNDDLLKALAQSQMQTNALLGKLVEQGQTAPWDTTNVHIRVPEGYDITNAPTNSTGSVPPSTATADFAVEDYVSVDGEPGRIHAVKDGGWYEVDTATGIKKVRKSSLVKED